MSLLSSWRLGTRKNLIESSARMLLHRLGGKLKVPRKMRAKEDKVKANAFKAELPKLLDQIVGFAPAQPVRL